MSRIAVMNSGGLKSAFLLELALKETEHMPEHVCSIFLRHGQLNCMQEAYAAKKLANRYKIQHQEFDVVPKVSPFPDGWPRFLFSTSLYFCATYAFQFCYQFLYCGFSIEQRPPLTEHGMEFLQTIQSALMIIQPRFDEDGLLLPQLEIEAPLALLDSKRIIRLGSDWDIPWELTRSCDEAGAYHCGLCQGCMNRQYAFHTAGVKDPTVYKSNLSYVDTTRIGITTDESTGD